MEPVHSFSSNISALYNHHQHGSWGSSRVLCCDFSSIDVPSVLITVHTVYCDNYSFEYPLLNMYGEFGKEWAGWFF